MTPEFKDHFSDRADRYAAYRPHYPPAVADYLASVAPRRDSAWDVGCGSGQMSSLLGDRFEHVIATDASSEQIARAVAHPHVRYLVGTAEQAPIGDRAVDLIVAAQAVHWFDLQGFYKEAMRVGRPGSTIALVAYARTEVEAPIDRVVDDFYTQVLGRWWPPERAHIETGYRNLDFPFMELRPPAIEMSVSWTVDQLIGYISTWSAVRAMEAAVGPEPTAEFATQVRTAWGPIARRRVCWPLKIRAGRIG